MMLVALLVVIKCREIGHQLANVCLAIVNISRSRLLVPYTPRLMRFTTPMGNYNKDQLA